MKTTRKILVQLILAAFVLCSMQEVVAQKVTQTVRGKITDKDSKEVLTGAIVVITGTSPLLGSASDASGDFKIQNVPVGRYDIKVTYMGYEEMIIPGILISSGKEQVLNIELNESVQKLEELVVRSGKSGEVLNQTALVSARSFSVEETKRYAGSFNDPSRMASSYAGVSGDPAGNNDIVIRGNSPRGLLWRLEGIEIPNPNHFSNEGASGGPISILNGNMLNNSDFFSGAFPSEYGNALSGVFDIKLRKGNNEQREYSLQAGVIGTDCSVEGPFSKGGRSSYLLNYRYSSLALLNAVGIKIAGDAVPKFQDLSLNLNFPLRKGTISVFGVSGFSTIEESDTAYANEFKAGMGVVGTTYMYPFNNTMYIKATASVSGSLNNWMYKEPDPELFEKKASENFTYINYRAQVELNKKFSAKHTVKTGIIVSRQTYDLYSDWWDADINGLATQIDDAGGTELMQTFINSKYRISDKLTLNSGLHAMYLVLNEHYSIEPRVGMKYQMTQTQSINAGFGIHSRMEPISGYLARHTYADGSSIQPNKNLDFTKARHYVLGYENMLMKDLALKAELYYQDLYNVPIEDSTNSAVSTLNYSQGYSTIPLANKGTGKNYGIDLTVEKYFSHQYYFLITTSLYESKYVAGDGIERGTRYNGNYVFNLLGGKEFTVFKGPKQRTLGISLKGSYAGGNRYTPIDLAESRRQGYTVVDESKTLSMKTDDFLRFDLKMSLRHEKKRSSRVWEIDIQNVTNNLNVAGQYYDGSKDEIVTYTQLGILPTISYRIEF